MAMAPAMTKARRVQKCQSRNSPDVLKPMPRIANMVTPAIHKTAQIKRAAITGGSKCIQAECCSPPQLLLAGKIRFRLVSSTGFPNPT